MRSAFVRILWLGPVVLGASVSAQSPGPPAQAWTLDAVVTAALAQHPLVEAARAQVSAAEGARRTTGAFPNPVATYWFENVGLSDNVSAAVTAESNIYGTLPLEPFLQRGSRIGQADHEVRAAQALVARAEQNVAADAVHAFYRVGLGQAALDAARENLAAIDEVVVYLRNRVTQGAAPEADLIRSQVERDRAETEVTLADVELLRAQATLRPFLGEAARGEVRVAAPVSSSDPRALASAGEFVAHALSQRADLQAARAKASAAASAVALERSMVLRQLGASFGIKRTSGVTAMEGGLSFAVPLFDQNRGEIARATGERAAAEMETRWVERSITSEVEAAYQAAERLAARVIALQPAFLSRAEESRRIALGTYQEGATTLLTVLDASRALSEARLTYARLVAEANQTWFDLGVAAGYDARAAALLGRGPTRFSTTEGGSR